MTGLTGPEHYAEAVRLLQAAKTSPGSEAEIRLQAAGVHAQLANAAAVIDCFGQFDREWRDVVPYPHQGSRQP